MSTIKATKKGSVKWTKKLYIRTNYPDNHVDHDSFLELKKTNVNAKFYKYWPTVFNSGIITHQLSSVVIFALTYVYLRFDVINVNDLMTHYIVPIGLSGYALKLVLLDRFHLNRIKTDLMNLIKFVSFTYGLAPILNSLTETISSDTIFAMSTCMLGLNLITHNYDSSQSQSEVAIVSKTFSFNAALFACVCLASRFNTSPFHTFSLVSIAFIMFALWPEYRRDLQDKYPISIVLLTIIKFVICIALFYGLKLWSFGIIYILAFVIITFICPWLLVTLQVYKNTIHGPWDEATIKYD